MSYWIEFKQPALAPNRRSLELLSFAPQFRHMVGAGIGPGHPTIESFLCTRESDDPASQLLYHASTTAQAFGEVILSIRDRTECDKILLQYTLMLATVGRYIYGDAPGMTGHGLETFELTFQNMKGGKV